MAKTSSVIIKRSPIVIIKNLILIELLGYGIFLFLGALADYGKIYQDLPLSNILSYHLAEVTFILGGELVMTFFVFFNWFYTYYRVSPTAVVKSEGTFFRKKIVFPLEHVDQVTYAYSPLGKMFNYGTLLLREGISQKVMRFRYVAFPQKYAALILKFKKLHNAGQKTPVKLETPSDIAALLHEEESEHLEFKSTMRWDVHAGRVNKQLEKMIMKTVAAFLNSGGGRLVVGVDDTRSVVGLEHDYKTLPRPDADGFENHFTHVFNSVIGAGFRQFTKLHFVKVGEKELCVIEVTPSARPAYVRFENAEEFYARTGNSTTPLKLSEAASYLEAWKRREG